MFDLNPLDILNQRKINTMPPHFAKVSIPIVLDNAIENWIKIKLKGRYCIVKMPGIDSKDSVKSIYYAGFEDQKESTYFMLACPFLRRI